MKDFFCIRQGRVPVNVLVPAKTKGTIRGHFPVIIPFPKDTVQHSFRIITDAAGQQDIFPEPDREHPSAIQIKGLFQLFIGLGIWLCPLGQQCGIVGARLGSCLMAQVLKGGLSGPVIELFVIENPVRLHDFAAAVQYIQDCPHPFPGQEIPLSYLPRRVPSPVTQKAAHNSRGFLRPVHGKSTFIILFLLRGNPQARFNIEGPPLRGQACQPLHRHLKFPCLQIPFCHQQGMQLRLILGKFCAFQLFLQGGRRGPDSLQVFKLIIDSLTDTGCDGGIFVHFGGLHLPLQGQGHGGRHLCVNLPDMNQAGPYLMKDLNHAFYVPLVFQTFAFCLPDQGVVLFIHQRIQHFRAL